MIILPPDSMSASDIAELRANDICVVVAKEPAKVEFVDPIPAASSRTEIDRAAIALCRKVINPGFWSADETRQLCAAQYVDLLILGTPLDPKPCKEELGRRAAEEAYYDEHRKIGREAAREERAAQKAKGAKK